MMLNSWFDNAPTCQALQPPSIHMPEHPLSETGPFQLRLANWSGSSIQSLTVT